jgi:hypothetical protein
MRKIALLISALVLFCLPVKAQEVADSTVFPKLDTLLARYTAAIERESVDVKKAESDFLISSVKDSLTTQHIALWLYDHYKESEVMGDEAVAIHVYDNWFKPGTIAMRSEFDRLDADIFVTFNRNTLLGMKAPVVDLRRPCGRKMKVPQDGSHSILFFFDTSCAKCQIESKVLPGILEKVEFPARFYAVFLTKPKMNVPPGWISRRLSFIFQYVSSSIPALYRIHQSPAP